MIKHSLQQLNINKRLTTVSSEDIKNIANKYFIDNNKSIVLIGDIDNNL